MMWTILLTRLTLAAPTTDLCTQAALDALAAEENERWAEINMLDISRVTHQLSDKGELVNEGVTLRKGDRVRIQGRPGTFKHHSTGHEREVWLTEQKGTILCFTRSSSGSFNNELAVVKWDAQRWRDDLPKEAMVKLPAFAATIHPSYLLVEPARAP